MEEEEEEEEEPCSSSIDQMEEPKRGVTLPEKRERRAGDSSRDSR